jgi:hypothetical protein
MVKLTPEQQGATTVLLKSVDKEALEKALSAAWRNTAPKRLSKGSKL